ncbi:MAG: hypothetical protein V4714_08190 [Bacteroidota bacterium]
MKKAILFLALVTITLSCKKNETCMQCEIAEGWHDVKGNLVTKITPVGMKCGDELEKFDKAPFVNSYAYSKENRCH